MLLEVQGLSISFDASGTPVFPVDDVSFSITPGEVRALVGESGCGKTLTSLAILGLLPPGARIAAGAIRFDNRDLLQCSRETLNAVRGNQIAMVFQEPMTSLNPLLSIGEQIAEPLRLHRRLSRRSASEQSLELLRRVGIPDPRQRIREYPHQMSGGMRQRVMIAAALACEPQLLIADEPTTALDVTIQAQVLDLLRELRERSGMAVLFVTHDLSLVAQLAHSVSVMYAGRIVEQAPTNRVLFAPQHPYTRALLRSVPSLHLVPDAASPAPARRQRLPVIPGEVPAPHRRPGGCAFHPRCDAGRDDPTCQSTVPTLSASGPDHHCACWHPGATAGDTPPPPRTGGSAETAYNRPS
jgi:oligopeptide/dipeptide ABC transporter ATP-binding protein